MLENLIIFDQIITKNIYGLLPRSFLTDSLFLFFSFVGDYALIWFIFFGFLVFFEQKKHKDFFIVFFSVLILSFFVSNYLLKYSFHRTRPINNIKISQSLEKQIQNYNFPKDYSFPSGHAATSFALATVLAYFDRKRRFLFYTIAILIAYSRIYLGVHYFFDIIGGALLGFTIAKLVINYEIKCSRTKKSSRQR